MIQAVNFKKMWVMVWLVASLALALQLFRIWDTYESLRQKFHRDIKTGLDKAVEHYYLEFGTRTISIRTDSFEKLNEIDEGTSIPKEPSNSKVQRAGNELVNEDFTENKWAVVKVSKDTVNMLLLKGFLDNEMDYYGLKGTYSIRHSLRGVEINEIATGNFSNQGYTITSDTREIPLSHKIELTYQPDFSYIFIQGGIEILLSIIFLLLFIFALWKLYSTAKRQRDLVTLKNDFVNNLSHEFKTPISAAKVAIEAAHNFNPENNIEKNKKYLKIAGNYLDQVSDMIDRLLESASFESESDVLEKNEIDLVKMIEGILKESPFDHHYDRIEFFSNTSSVKIQADQFHLKRSLVNVLDNALKYGGKKIIIRLETDQNEVSLSISDNGPGIAKEQIPKIFEQFYRIPGENLHLIKGHGIGLFFAKKVIEAHNGSIELNLKNGWTNFIIKIPEVS
jgi:two-component system phosphate regulon sensor histidine kinase PhoR